MQQCLENYSINPKTDKCIVLDLDETLVHTLSNMNDLKALNIFNDPNKLELRQRINTVILPDVYSVDRISMWTVHRPHLSEFIEFCVGYFKVIAVWTAGQADYANFIVDLLFSGTPPKVLYSYSHCALTGNIKTKPLEMIFKNPSVRGIMKPENTFILDDRAQVCLHNMDNALIIPAYSFDDSNLANLEKQILKDDQALIKLMNWLETDEVKKCKDVRKLDKTKIWK